MATLSFQDGALQAGISHHLRHLQKDSNVNASGGNVQARDLFFNVDTIKIAAMAGKWLHSIRKKPQLNNLAVYVTGLPGKTITLKLNDGDTVEDLKALIEDEEEISPIQQRLFLDGVELKDDKTLREYNVEKESTLHLVLQLQGGGCVAYKMHRECFDEEFHYDFTQILSDQQLFARGGAPYTRPLGSMRYALKVFDKYGDNAWLGISNRQGANGSIDGEWPVAYHGTTDPRAAEIVQSGGLDLSQGRAFAYGYGIYCTPDPEIALSYAYPYKYNGKYYKLILQARVDPSRREVIPHMNYWIAKENDAIRPYGICVFPCQI